MPYLHNGLMMDRHLSHNYSVSNVLVLYVIFEPCLLHVRTALATFDEGANLVQQCGRDVN